MGKNRNYAFLGKDQGVSSPFHPDTVRTRAEWGIDDENVRTLLMAVLYRGIHDFCKSIAAIKNEKDEEAFFASEVFHWVTDRQEDGIGSFIMLCETFGFSPDRWRMMLLNNPQEVLTTIKRLKKHGNSKECVSQ